jgi:hypothetical protein
MKKFIKWALLVVVLIAMAGFVVFLYAIPPLTSGDPADMVKVAASMPPPVTDIADPAQRLLAQRGRYLVMVSDCGGCHTTPGPQGPNPAMYLAGGMKIMTHTHGTAVSRNLTSDKATGLGGLTDEQILRVLQSGIHHSGRSFSYRAMPWSDTSHWTEEDRRAVVAYLRHLPAVSHAIPDPVPGQPPADVVESVYGMADYGKTPGK